MKKKILLIILSLAALAGGAQAEPGDDITVETDELPIVSRHGVVHCKGEGREGFSPRALGFPKTQTWCG